MTPHSSLRVVGCLALCSAGLVAPLFAVELLRGPYLQSGWGGGVTVCWRTDAAVGGAVWYGVASNALDVMVIADAPVTEHQVALTGLQPATRYYYAVGDTNGVLRSGADCSFVTAPPVGTVSPTRVWVVGDSGGLSSGYGNPLGMRNAFYAAAGGRPPEVWLALGDNAYDVGSDAEYQTNFFSLYGALLPQVPVWSTIGNHETYGVGLPYLDIFAFPTNGECGGVASGTERYYSFDYANAHFVCLDSMAADRTTNGPMAAWLRRDLAAHTNQWLIAFWHHPPYGKGDVHDSDWDVEMIEMRQNFLPLLEASDVDLVFNGHNHDYERSYLLAGHYGKSATLQPEMLLDAGTGRDLDTGAYIKSPQHLPQQGCVYVIAGCGSGGDPLWGPKHPAMFYQESQAGSVVLDLNGNRLDGQFLRADGTVGDRFAIVKGEAAPLRICTYTFLPGKVVLRWKSLRQENYRVEQTADWQSTNWQPAGAVITATGATTSWTNSFSASGPQFFYRVVRIPPPTP